MKPGEELGYKFCIIDALTKLYKPVINSKLIKEIEEKRKLTEYQHRFMKNHSTTISEGLICVKGH